MKLQMNNITRNETTLVVANLEPRHPNNFIVGVLRRIPKDLQISHAQRVRTSRNMWSLGYPNHSTLEGLAAARDWVASIDFRAGRTGKGEYLACGDGLVALRKLDEVLTVLGVEDGDVSHGSGSSQIRNRQGVAVSPL
jgi:hypothetical protein